MNLRKIVVMLLFIVGAGVACAEDGLTVKDVAIPKDGKAMLAIETAFESDAYFGYQLEVVLPKGVSISLDKNGRPSAESYTELDIVGSIISSTSESTTYQFVASKMGNPHIPAGSYVLVVVPVETDGTLSVGDALDGSIRNILFSDGTQKGMGMADVKFAVDVTDKLVLDENSPIVPLATDDVTDLLVKRTIKANVWSTLCLPFDMPANQVRAVFGDNVQLAAFVNYEMEDGAILVNFADIDLTEEDVYANYPYIIKATADISEFEVTAQVVSEEESAIEVFTKKVGRKDVVFGKFIGTLHAGTVIPEKNLFLNNNKFYYSVGKSKSKAFRAYFWFEDVLADLDSASSRMSMNFNEKDVSGIGRLTQDGNAAETIYDLQGRRVAKAVKGIYMLNGKKIVVK